MANESEWIYQVNLKCGYHLFNFRAKTDQELMDFMGFTVKPTPEMVMRELVRIEKSMRQGGE